MPTLIIIAGPTASGKTALSIDVARHFNTEVISADSRQFYKEMSIGTAKPNPEEQGGIKHHLVDFISVTEEYTAAGYAQDVHEILADIFSRKKIAVMTGGSGLFIKAAIEGFDDLPKVDPEIREELNEKFEKDGVENLQQELQVLDPVTYQTIDLKNPRRVIRALEICIGTGKPYSSFLKTQNKKPEFDVIKIGLELPREELYDRINRRCNIMLEQGLLLEVEKLYPYRNLKPVKTIGYSEFFDYLEGKTDYETAVDLFKQHTRNYAKRQLTWFRNDKDIVWFKPDDFENIIAFIEQKINHHS
jgi:tRNA dimethylallyltransferase